MRGKFLRAAACAAALVVIIGPTPDQSSAATKEPNATIASVTSSLANPFATKKITLDNLDPARVRQSAFEITQSKIARAKRQIDLTSHHLTPNVDRELVSVARRMIPTMAGFYKDLVTVRDFTFIWANTKDGKNLKQIFCKELNQCLDIKPSKFCNLGVGPNYYAYCHDDGANKNLFAMYLMHGYTHAVQVAISTDHTPNWFGEGTAQYFENHFARIHYGIKNPTFSPDFTHTTDILYSNQKLVKFKKNPTRRNFVDAFVATENRKPENGREQAQLGYYPGALAVEALIATHGIDTLFTFWKSTKNKDFYVAFEDTYGMTTREFYKKLAPYAVAMIKRDRK